MRSEQEIKAVAAVLDEMSEMFPAEFAGYAATAKMIAQSLRWATGDPPAPGPMEKLFRAALERAKRANN